MTVSSVADFLTQFDDSRFPEEFLQRYELMECFSHNELGETLLVKDNLTGEYGVAKCYADKTLLSHSTESELLKKLHYKGIPAYIAEYQNEKMLCVVRLFIEGISLDQLVQERSLTKAQIIDITVQLCDILIYLHRQFPPIIHRDIKPQNIIFTEQGEIALIDFGISRTYSETESEDTLCFGTKYFAAPEQYGFSQTDCRSDIFSLGILLHWLLTGSVEVNKGQQDIPDRRLAQVIKKCTAFDPQDRYKNAAQVKDALLGKKKRRGLLAVLGSMILIVGIIFHFAPWKLIPESGGVTFQEPLIEEAIRLALGKDETAEISEVELLNVHELFIYGDKAAADVDEFNFYADDFANSGNLTHRGSIENLADVTELKALRSLYLVYQNITDLSPLAELTALDHIDLRHNPLSDISPLSQIPPLEVVSLFGTNVSDLTALNACPALNLVDVGYTQITSMKAFAGLDSLQTLVMRKTPLQSLEHIDEILPSLEEIYLSETPVEDLSPLLLLPNLQLVEVDETMRSAAEAIEDQAQFTIICQ